jgi:hypothetical protein
MRIGQIARKIFGKHFYILGNIYRSFFVDLNKVAQSISPFIPQGATIADVGGGDGAPLNYLFSHRQDIKVKLIDISQDIGKAVKKEFSTRIELYPSTSVGEFTNKVGDKPSVILLSDVIHHIAGDEREEFFSHLKKMVDERGDVRIIIKDIEPGYLRSFMGLMADKYISGDKTVSLVARKDIFHMMAGVFENTITMEETELFELDKPNYALVFSRN